MAPINRRNLIGATSRSRASEFLRSPLDATVSRVPATRSRSHGFIKITKSIFSTRLTGGCEHGEQGR